MGFILMDLMILLEITIVLANNPKIYEFMIFLQIEVLYMSQIFHIKPKILKKKNLIRNIICRFTEHFANVIAVIARQIKLQPLL